MTVDYSLLKTISDICRDVFAWAARSSTAPRRCRGHNSQSSPTPARSRSTLALGFNNLIFDHPSLPQALKDQIRDYTFANHAHERGPDDNDAQFFYNSRKKAWKVMKKPFWDMANQAQDGNHDVAPSDVSVTCSPAMNVGGTSELVRAHTTVTKIAPPKPEALRQVAA